VGLLPIWLISGIDAVCDLSGLAGNKELVAGLSRVGWQDVNSDRMQPIQEAVTAEAAQNKVFFNGQEQRIEEHWEEIVRGFSDLHGLIVSRKQSFLEFLSSLSSARSRVIFRSTSVYSKLIKESTHPDALRSGIRRSLVFERLFRPLLKGQSLSSHTKKLLNFEVERLSLLASLTIPLRSIEPSAAPLSLNNSLGRAFRFVSSYSKCRSFPVFLTKKPLQPARMVRVPESRFRK
jgi:lantibiotic modifying enzyme